MVGERFGGAGEKREFLFEELTGIPFSLCTSEVNALCSCRLYNKWIEPTPRGWHVFRLCESHASSLMVLLLRRRTFGHARGSSTSYTDKIRGYNGTSWLIHYRCIHFLSSPNFSSCGFKIKSTHIFCGNRFSSAIYWNRHCSRK
jgi:hypothetical protein